VSGVTWLALVALAVVAAACAWRALVAARRPGGKLLAVELSLEAYPCPPANRWRAPEAELADLAAAGQAAKGVARGLPDPYLLETRR
jgi:hypothetical protein